MRHLIQIILFLLAIAPTSTMAIGSDKLSAQLALPDSVLRGASADFRVAAEIAGGWHVNAHEPTDPFLIPTVASFDLPEGIRVTDVAYPEPEEHEFAFAAGKMLLVYDGKIQIPGKLHVDESFRGSTAEIVATVRYQACNDTTCMPPRNAIAKGTFKVRDTAAVAPAAGAPAAGGAGSGIPGVGIDFAAWLSERGLGLTLLLIVALGLGLNLTPCVYPLISVTIAFFGSQAQENTGRRLRLALAYVLGITLTFSAVGVAAAFSGGIFGAALQKPPVLVFIAGVLTILAMSSFGFFQLQAPTWLMQKVGGSTQGAVGALFMGSTMGIVAAPCVGPVVLGLIVFAGSQQSVPLGLAMFFALGLGLGLPYVGLAMAAGSINSLPRSGDWMVWIERLFGFLLLGLAVYFIAPLLPKVIAVWVVPALIAGAAVFLGFVDRSGNSLAYFPPIKRVAGIAGIALATWFAWPQPAESQIRWQVLDVATAERAGELGRPSVIDFVAEWCIPCHEMEVTTFADPAVLEEAGRFEMFKADITTEDETTTALIERFAVQGVPTVIYLDSNGNEVQRFVGYVGPEQMLEAMRQTT